MSNLKIKKIRPGSKETALADFNLGVSTININKRAALLQQSGLKGGHNVL